MVQEGVPSLTQLSGCGCPGVGVPCCLCAADPLRMLREAPAPGVTVGPDSKGTVHGPPADVEGRHRGHPTQEISVAETWGYESLPGPPGQATPRCSCSPHTCYATALGSGDREGRTPARATGLRGLTSKRQGCPDRCGPAGCALSGKGKGGRLDFLVRSHAWVAGA